MPTLHVRNIPEEMHQAILALASQEQRSFGAEVVILLDQALQQRAVQAQRAMALDAIGKRRRSFRKPEGAADSLTLLREDRAR